MSVTWKEVTKFLSDAANRKWILWTVLIAGGLFFLNKRYISVNGLFTSVDMIILLFWIALLLMPFFQEISFYGLKLRKEIDELKFDINRQFIDLSRDFISLRSEVNNSNDAHSNVNNNITVLRDDQLNNLSKGFKHNIEETLDARGVKLQSESELTEVPDDVKYIFSVRYQVEKELKRIFNETSSGLNCQHTAALYTTSNEWKPKRMRLTEIVRVLTSNGLIDPYYSNIIMQVNGIASSAIHGEEISKGQINFIHDTAPELITILKEIK